jgi:hypothetical protein
MFSPMNLSRKTLAKIESSNEREKNFPNEFSRLLLNNPRTDVAPLHDTLASFFARKSK